ISGTMRPMSPRPAGPKEPPEVNWIVAVHELSKLIIPSDRQTRSHAPEDLAPVRVKKDRLSAPVMIPAEPVAGGRQLRTRKPKGAGTVSPPTETEMQAKPLPVDLARRQTISELPTPASVEPAPIEQPKRTTRRTSNMFDLKTEAADVPPVPAMPSQLPPSSPKKSRAKALKPVLPEEPVIKQEPHVKQEPEPFFKLENRPTRPEPKRYPSEPSVPTAMPLTIDYTKPINHIQPLRPVGIKRIHLKVGTREEHDRKVKEMEEKAKAEARAKSTMPEMPVSEQVVEQVAPKVEQDEHPPKVELGPASDLTEQQASRRPPASASKTVPSELMHRDSPLYLDVEESAPQQAAGASATPSQPQAMNPQQMQAVEKQGVPDTANLSTQGQASQSQTALHQPRPQQQSNLPIQQQTFFNPSYTHPQNNLPIFSSTGAIPFAPAQARPSGPNPVSGHGNGVSRSMLEELPTLKKVITPDDVDMMDLDSPEKKRDGQKIIPETPQH
ncbi:hypothetical protein KCU64_g18526, partial [Aureobasidium melanogenum]